MVGNEDHRKNDQLDCGRESERVAKELIGPIQKSRTSAAIHAATPLIRGCEP